jgi:tetratricopeptide (TPR) repeat protein
MTKVSRSALNTASPRCRVLAIEAEPGAARLNHLQELLLGFRKPGVEAHVLPCSWLSGGPWAGVKELFRAHFEDLADARPDLVERATYELVHVMPELRRRLIVKNPILTDLAPLDERVRNFPADRAYRIVHGLVDLLDGWSQERDVRQWVLACDSLDKAGAIGQRFFAELVRRRGLKLGVTILAGVKPGSASAVLQWFPVELRGETSSVDVAVEPESPPAPDLAAREAAEEEAAAGEDIVEVQLRVPRMIQLWTAADNEIKALRWRCWGLEIYNTQGLYEDAMRYGAGALAEAQRLAPTNIEAHWSIFIKIFMSLVGLKQIDEAAELATRFLPSLTDRGKRGRVCYMLAMIHGRFSPQRNLARAEELLEAGLNELQAAELDEAELCFQTVFNRNGLAMVRVFQRRFDEALELCQNGLTMLEGNLPPERHRLHRSVLLYNIAQVHAAVGDLPRAAEGFGRAMTMDPYYSEYYNWRGSIYLKMGEHKKAVTDFRRAIELSPPYHEVFSNLGQCLRDMGDYDEALEAYSRSLDLEPEEPVALAGRASILEAKGSLQAATDDYDRLLTLEPDRWEALASRAVCRFELGQFAESNEDLERAIRLSPVVAALYQNRSVVLAELGRMAEAATSLRRYLDLAKDAEDREEMLRRLVELEGSSTPDSTRSTSESFVS